MTNWNWPELFEEQKQSGKTIAVVCVTQSQNNEAQCWSRLYEQPSGFPQVIQSNKRFTGSTGLEEYIGYGIGMALTIRAENEALIFESDHYFLSLLGIKLTLPRYLTFGKLQVIHKEEANDLFSFTLRLTHSLLGTLIYQHAQFKEC